MPLDPIDPSSCPHSRSVRLGIQRFPFPPYRVYLLVWGALILLTGFTIGVSFVDMKQLAILTAVLIAAVKSSLVLLYFMHLRYEKAIFFWMILVVMVTYGVFITLTFSDYLYR